MTAVLSIRVSVSYGSRPVLKDVCFDLAPGEVFGIVGRSGCGKSTLAGSILALLPRKSRVEGEVRYGGRDLLKCTERELRAIRGKDIALVLQAAASALNPWLTLDSQFREAWAAHSGQPWRTQRDQVFELFRTLQLEPTEEFLQRYPRQISVGQAQRVLIAMALLHQPRVLILDEPTSALDCVARAEVQSIVARLSRETGVSILHITHDLWSVAATCGRIGVLDEGCLVQTGSPEEVFSYPEHPASFALANAFRNEPLRPLCLNPKVVELGAL
ncbi:MAG TPA: ABC transporter ATP-binding protein [Bryobacteraceae bacterium]|nr:ABC transporter ATP-binding protein [Bryobacteraceae bacterium]